MIAIADQQERFAGKLPGKPLQQVAIIQRRHTLTTDVLIYIRGIAEIAPTRGQFGTQTRIPGEMVGHGVNVEKKRSLAPLALHNVDGSIEIKTVSLEITRTEVDHVKITRDPDTRLKS